MGIDQMVTILINTGIYAIMAFGLSLIFGVLGLVNISHPGVMMLGAFITFELVNIGIHPFVALLLIIPIFFLFGCFMEKSLIAPLPPEKRKGLNSLLLLLGAWLIMQNAAYYVWGPDPRSIFLDDLTYYVINIGPVSVGLIRLSIFIIALLSLLFVNIFFNKTYIGSAIRAASESIVPCKLVGIKVENIATLSFGLGISITGFSGGLLSLLYTFTPEFGSYFLIRIFAIVILGGLGNFIGVIIGAFVIAVFEFIGGTVFGIGWANAVIFILLIFALVFMPQGITPKLIEIKNKLTSKMEVN